MSTTMAIFERRVRTLINDTRWSDPVVQQERLRELTTSAMHLFGERVGYPTDYLTTLALVAGTGDYTLNAAANYSQIISLQLASTGQFLCKWTPEQLEARYPADTARAIPTDYAAWENASQQVEIRVRPIPDAAYTVNIRGALVPARLTSDAAVLPFSEPMISALVKAVAADCISATPQAELEKLHTNMAVAQTFRSDAEAALVSEEIRRNRLKRTGRNETVDV